MGCYESVVEGGKSSSPRNGTKIQRGKADKSHRDNKAKEQSATPTATPPPSTGGEQLPRSRDAKRAPHPEEEAEDDLSSLSASLSHSQRGSQRGTVQHVTTQAQSATASGNAEGARRHSLNSTGKKSPGRVGSPTNDNPFSSRMQLLNDDELAAALGETVIPKEERAYSTSSSSAHGEWMYQLEALEKEYSDRCSQAAAETTSQEGDFEAPLENEPDAPAALGFVG